MIYSTLYTTLPYTLFKDKLNLIERIFPSEGSAFLASNDRNAFSLWNSQIYHARSCKNVCDALTFYTILHKVVGTPMHTNCVPLGTYLFLFSYESDFMMSLSDNK